jgi:sugar phosphate isomerase/epimerase
MIPCLNPATTGGGKSLEEFIAVAAKYGYGGVDFDIGAVARVLEQKSAGAARQMFVSAGVEAAAFGLPVNFRQDETTFKNGLKELPRLSGAAAEVGCTRCCTWLPPSIDESVAEFTCRVVRRLSECAKVLADHEIQFAIEWVGPATARTRKHDFIHTLEGDLELIAAINQPNTGLLFDSFHWFTMGGTVSQIEALPLEMFVHVHVNDAPDKPVDMQMDMQRLLPGEGIIDLKGMLGALKKKGYKGFLSIETFNKEVRELGLDAGARKAKSALDGVLAGL